MPIQVEDGLIKKEEGDYPSSFTLNNKEKISDDLIEFGIENIRIAQFTPVVVNPETFEEQIGLLIQNKQRIQKLVGRYDKFGNNISKDF